MLALDSLVLDLIFKPQAELQPEVLVEALGGEDILTSRTILDPDMQDPRLEMELSPSMPFRRRGERRLLLIDASVAPMRKEPQADPLVPLDLRAEKERLIKVCETGAIRFGRLFALGSWGDAVWVAESARDMRGIALLPWVLDPQIDVTGKRRASPLSEAEFEEKILAFDKRLEELGEDALLRRLGPANFERRGDLLVVDVLENDGTWDQRKSFVLEQSMAAVEAFSILPGAPAAGAGAGAEKPASPPPEAAAVSAAAPAPPKAPENAPERAPGPPLRTAHLGSRLLLVFPEGRFDLDVAAALGKKDWETVLAPGDDLSGEDRDRLHREGAGFVAPLEFLSEVFRDGKPLTRAEFESDAVEVGSARALEVHFPRFGSALLLATADGKRFVSSETDDPGALLGVLGA